ncbi:MAG TPA: ASKHA domain-containing protein [Anaeromyxobacteraceae bacterium]|nr:ASKHA domain-containing protein [Anaeromyxobacteraceae bacterium]
MAPGVYHIGVRLEDEGDEAVRHIPFRPGPSLCDILNSSSARVRTACAGIGACGVCRVRIDEGYGGVPTVAELLHLGEEDVAARMRLACQVIPCGDMDVTVLEPVRSSLWRTSALASYRAAYPLSPGRAAKGLPLGIAVDLGTTQITVAICDLSCGCYLAIRSGPNPQACLSSDVIGRLDAAASLDQVAQQMRRWVVDAIGRALLDMSQGEGIDLAGVGRVRVVGNSAMLILLSARRPEALLDPAGWTAPIDRALDDVSDLGAAWNLSPSAGIELVEPLGGFVGSDLLAGAIHCRLAMSSEAALLIDFGTNSEICLWDGDRLWATAAAGGPAFEATGIGCGMGAEPGAVHRLSRSPDGVWFGEILGSPPPRGLCGSGLVDILAILRAGGEIDERGRILAEPLTIALGGIEFTISKYDVDMLQRAKAAIAAGIEVLLRRAGLRADQIATVHVAGSFGEHLDAGNAERIGLLPQIPLGRVRLAGNTALQGALDLLFCDEAERALAQARSAATLVSLSMEQEFEELFVDHLYIRPIAVR